MTHKGAAPSRTKHGGAVSFGRSEKYHPRDRHLYALLFPGEDCYIGQTVDLARRKAEHISERGGWLCADFTMIHLGTIHGTHSMAEDYEFAWRYKAAKAGWTIVGRPPRLVVNPHRRMNFRRYWIALGLRWPWRHRLCWPGWLIGMICMGLATSTVVFLTSMSQAT